MKRFKVTISRKEKWLVEYDVKAESKMAIRENPDCIYEEGVFVQDYRAHNDSDYKFNIVSIEGIQE